MTGVQTCALPIYHLYRELRIENTLVTADGEKVKLKPGAEVDVTIEAPPEATVKSNEATVTKG